jgi:hypothetical protein
MNTLSEIERLQKAVEAANAAGAAAWENAYFKAINEAKKEQDNVLAN